MNVKVYSREEAEKMLEACFPENTAVISFYDPKIKRIDSDYSHVDYSEKCSRVFFSELDDLDIGYLGKKGLTYDMYFPEVNELAEFIYSAYEDGLDIICQCEYGQSRSAGCAAAILEHFYKTGISVFADYKRYPNQVVYHKVFDALEKYKSSMKKTSCRSYFSICSNGVIKDITGFTANPNSNFNPEYITAKLGIEPFEVKKMNEPRKNGHGVYPFSSWSCCEQTEPSIDAEEQVLKIVRELKPLIPILTEIKNEFDVNFMIGIVPYIYNELTPVLCFNKEIIEFCHLTGTEIDVDLYVFDKD